MQEEKRMIREMHIRHVKLMASNLMFKSLSHGLLLWKTELFNEFADRLRKTHERKGAARKFRRFIRLNTTMKLRTAFFQWYHKLNPQHQRKYQNKLPRLIQDKECRTKAYFAWKALFCERLSSRSLNHRFASTILKVNSSFDTRL